MKVYVLVLLTVFTITGCMRSDRQHIPGSKKFLGIAPYDWMKPRAYRNNIFDGTPGESAEYNDSKQGEIDTDQNTLDRYRGERKRTQNASYAEGYKAGCQTMTSAMGSGFYRVRGPNVDPEKLTTDPWYLRGYQDGTHICTFNLDWETH